ncbi:MAG: cysteine desulfurase family protein [Desulfosudaceae bacterium]
MTPPIYLDYNGTTPLLPEARRAMEPFLGEEFGNASSAHWYGIAPRRALEHARQQTAALIGCRPEEIIFTSGGTESNNHALKGMAELMSDRGNHIITTAIEHPAITEVCSYLREHGRQITALPVDTHGRVAPADVEAAIRPETILISVMHANNEIGTIQPLEEIAEIANRHDLALHTDAAQSIGKIPVSVKDLEVALLSLAGHKLYAPKGIGALYVRRDIPLPPFCHGAGQENSRRAGTENIAAIVGLGAACEAAARDLEAVMVHLAALRDRLHQGLQKAVPDIRLNGHPEKRLPNTLSLSLAGIDADRLLETIGPEVAASAGAACHADTVKVSHVLQAIDLPREWARGTVRFSVGRMTTESDIDRAARAVSEAARSLRRDRGIKVPD